MKKSSKKPKPAYIFAIVSPTTHKKLKTLVKKATAKAGKRVTLAETLSKLIAAA